eukprot:Cvel_11749.t1-p1 / transcript=Cvel_11749.t1 / gene=Cvel_11749 / organism=Chromera_velia_CCMP2878 / gene_product=hypothetical protein / transcript_product=hypothetical protein / location=Cvel_scaffold746:56735-58396(+) / protein_length=476 / sequence_SO=supercontig / SO=protein_coding / is_pseudo=false
MNMCRCCGESLSECSRTWKRELGVAEGSIKNCFLFYPKGKAACVGLGCAMEALTMTSSRKYKTDMCIYWMHLKGVIALLRVDQLSKFVAMGNKLKRHQDLESRFPSVYISKEQALEFLYTHVKVSCGLPNDKPGIFVLSYPWHSAQHLDPSGSTIRDVLKLIESMQKAEARRPMGGLNPDLITAAREDGERLLHEKLQQEAGGHCQGRQEGESEEQVDTEEGTQWTEQYFLKGSPPPISPDKYGSFSLLFQDFCSLYQWDFYAVQTFRFEDLIQLGPLPEDWCEVSISPLAFRRRLEEGVEGGEEYAVKFTNGFDDRPRVLKLYTDFLKDALVKGRREIRFPQSISLIGKSKGEAVRELFRWIGEQSDCTVDFVSIDTSDESLPFLVAGLSAIPSLLRLCVLLFPDDEMVSDEPKTASTLLEHFKPLQQLKHLVLTVADIEGEGLVEQIRKSKEMRALKKELPRCQIVVTQPGDDE